ncbi:MAG: hypothetical protein KAQ75_13995 [Bacteroidales bacterium]|nr:hypothetical protein [Bacteroidales bacterium]
MCIIEIVKNNINWIKDLFTIIFAGSATVIAILTYRRAKKTVLQPMRTEVIKTQIAEILKILDFVAQHNYSPKSLYDYYSLLRVNLDILLCDLGLIEMTSELKKELNNKIAGWVIFTDKLESKLVYVNDSYDVFVKTQSIFKEKSKKNISEIEINKINVVFYTKKYIESYKSISMYAENPLLPKDIIFLLMKMKYDGKFNLILNLQETIIYHFNEYKKLTIESKLNYNTESDLNRKSYLKFEQKRFKHDSDILKLKDSIRKYLRIDENWL